MKPREERLLRELVRRQLREDWSDYGLGGGWGGGITPWSGGHGGSSKHSKSAMGFGTYGNSLFSIFVQPFVDAAKVTAAELGQVGVRLVSLLSKAVEASLDILVPGFKANYDKIDKIQRKYLDKIKEKYKGAYEAMNDAWDHPDIQLFSFLHDPTTWLTYRAITAKPQAVLGVYDAIVEGSQTLTLYLRDIRNRLFGASTPGAGMEAGPLALPVTTHEGRSLRAVLREGDVKKSVLFQGLSIDIDRPKGFVQKGEGPDGEPWERTYLYDYGFIKGTEGGDGEDLDVFVGPDQGADTAYLVTQNKHDGSFDEYKAFVGFPSVEDAVRAYGEHIPLDLIGDVSSVPVGALKGLVGLDPLEEAGPGRPKTPGEQLADILTSPQFLEQIRKLPVVKQMRQDADAIQNQSSSELQSAMSPVLGARTAQDLAQASGGRWQVPAEYAQLGPDEREAFDDVLTEQVKASMATYYGSRLGDLIKTLTETGISDQSPYVASLRRTIASLDAVKQAAASGGTTNAQGQGRSAPAEPAGRAEGPGQPGGGVHQQAQQRGRGDRPAQSPEKGTLGGVQRKIGREDADSSPEGAEDPSERGSKAHV